MSSQLTFEVSLSAISLPALADGPTRCASPPGRKKERSGPALVHANHSVARAKEKAKPMSATSGQCSENLSLPADHPSSLGSKSPRRRSLVTKEKDREYQMRYRKRHRARDLIRHAVARAAKKKMEFDLWDHLPKLQERIDRGLCEVTGLPFNLDNGRTWDSPSIDRIDSKAGYTYSNLRIVCHAVNSAMGDWGEAKLMEIAQAIMNKRRAASNELSEKLGKALMKNLAKYGSPEYRLTWRRHVTPSGQVIYRHRASARRTSDNDCSGWPTPNAMEGGQTSRGGDRKDEKLMGGIAKLCGWRTPTQGDSQRGVEQNPKERNAKAGTASLNNEVALSGWPSPRGNSSTGKCEHGDGGTDLQTAVQAAGWNSPRATDGSNGGPNQANGALANDAAKAGWASPSSRDWKDTPGMATTATNPDGSERTRLDQLPRQATLAGWATLAAMSFDQSHQPGQDRLGVQMKEVLASGDISNGTSATTSRSKSGEGFLLNPRFSLWLQGFPEEWLCSAVLATLSTQGRRRNSSKHI